MKNFFKKVFCIVGGLVIGDVALAHSLSGNLGKKTSSAAATDVYLVSCYDDDSGAGIPNKISVHVKDNAPKLVSAISVQVVKSGLASVPSVDAVDGDASYSPEVSLTKGAGEYTVLVNKSAATVKGLESYALEFHCQSASGAHAGTDWSMTQNQ